MAAKSEPKYVQVSPRGQVTLPARIRSAVGIEPGDPLTVSVEDGRIVLSPAVIVPIEHYTDEQLAEFEQAAEMTSAELKKARRKWKV